jgi:hypothetical protein
VQYKVDPSDKGSYWLNSIIDRKFGTEKAAMRAIAEKWPTLGEFIQGGEFRILKFESRVCNVFFNLHDLELSMEVNNEH